MKTRFTCSIGNGARLAPLELSDADVIFNETNKSRRYLREYLGWVDHVKSVEDTRNFIISEAKHVSDGQKVNATIWLNERYAGICGLFNIDKINRSASIGYWLGESFQGNGLMTRSVEALVDHAFQQLELNRVEIRTHPKNIASQGVARRLGFVLEGTLAQAEWLNAGYADSRIYGLTADRWKAQSSSRSRAR